MGLHHSPRIVTDGLVLCLDAADKNSYPGSGNTWYDLSGQGNNGTLVNDPTFITEKGGGFSFDGTNDVVESTNKPSLQLTSTFSICCYCKLNSTSNNGHVAGKDDVSSGRSISFGYGGSGNFRLLVVKNSSTIIYSNATNITDNNVYHIACTYDANGGVVLYKNSAIDYQNGTSSGEIDNVSTIWTFGATTNNIFEINGDIYSVQIYNRALTPQEIQQNYNATKTRFGL